MSADDFRAQLRRSRPESPLESHADDGATDVGRTDEDAPAAAPTAPEADDDDSEPRAYRSSHALDPSRSEPASRRQPASGR